MAARKAAAPEITGIQHAFISASEEADPKRFERLERSHRAATEEIARLEKEVAALRAGRGQPIRTSASARVFISYRREDSAAFAGRVHDRLERDLGRNLLFMDVDAIPLGVNFVNVLRDEVAKCDVLLAVIGPRWLDARDEHGNRRLDDPNDFLRIEIATALQCNIPVIPILVDGAKVPKAGQLPKDLEELEQRNGLEIRHASFRSDIDKLIRELTGPSGQPGEEKTETVVRTPSDEGSPNIGSKSEGQGVGAGSDSNSKSVKAEVIGWVFLGIAVICVLLVFFVPLWPPNVFILILCISFFGPVGVHFLQRSGKSRYRL